MADSCPAAVGARGRALFDLLLLAGPIAAALQVRSRVCAACPGRACCGLALRESLDQIGFRIRSALPAAVRAFVAEAALRAGSTALCFPPHRRVRPARARPRLWLA
eukprot:365259-Chlamydomonas_euryale.AAC.6